MHANSEAWTRRAGPGKAAGAGRETRIIPQAPAGFQRGGRDQEMVARDGDSNGRGGGPLESQREAGLEFPGLCCCQAVISAQVVIPAKAGIQRLQHHPSRSSFP
ncbi:hypothetical protein [Lysobacter gummosus]|uniref:hypothetical protein n=1 Tax=Lysobacter gummosus TaxID=262324 RepID=UPI003627C534